MEKYAWLFLAIPVAYLFVMVFSGAVRAHRDAAQQVLSQGILGDAEILEYHLTGKYKYVVYTFVPEGRAEPLRCERQLHHVPLFGFQKFELGTPVPVKYLPKFPTVSLLVPYAKFQCPT
jgi:hypothetical protein